MVLAAKAREAEETAVRARFFDQQEAINKELNRLRNVTGCYDTTATDANASGAGANGGALSSSSQGLSNPSPSANPLTGGSDDRPATAIPSGFNTGAPRKSADALRAELNQDASIRALQERVALAGRHRPLSLPTSIPLSNPPSAIRRLRD